MWNKIIFLFFLFLPFSFALNVAEGFDVAAVRVAIAVIFLLWLMEGLAKKKLTLPASPTTFLVVAFLLLALLSVFIAQNTAWAARKFLFLLNFLLLYFPLAALLRERKITRDTIFRPLIFSGALTAAVGVAQFLAQFVFGLVPVLDFWRERVAPIFLGDTFSQSVNQFSSFLVNVSGETIFRAVSVFPDPHTFAFFLGLTTPIALGYFLKTTMLRSDLAARSDLKGSKKSCLFLFSFFFFLSCALLTFSRGAYAGLFFGAVFFGASFVRKRATVVSLGVLIGAALLTTTVLLTENPLSSRLLSSFDSADTSNQGRIAMWRAAADAIEEYPVSGVGLGNFPIFVDPTADYRTPIYAHNVYLDIAAEMGIPVAAVFIALLAITSWRFFKKRNDPVFLGAATALIIFSVHSLFDTAIYSVQVLPVLIALFSTGSGFSRSDLDARSDLEKKL